MLANLEQGYASAPAAEPFPIGPGIIDDPEGMYGWKVGQLVDVRFVVSPKLAKQRACILPDAIDGLRCAHTSAKEPFADAPPHTSEKLLQVYETPDGRIFLGAGLWTLPLSKARLDRHPETPIFLSCKLRVSGRGMIGYRFRDAHHWQYSPGPYDAGRFESCALSSPGAVDAATPALPDASVEGSALMGGVGVAGGSLPNAPAMVARLRGRFRRCYEQGLNRDPDMQGAVTLVLKVAPDGTVADVGGGGGADLAPIVACLKAVAKTARFDSTPNGAIVTVPMTFKKE